VVIIEALLVGLAIGAVLGLIGAGGAVVAVPAFIYLFGLSSLQATTASLAVVAVSAATGAIPRMRQGQVRMRQALLFWSLGIIGTFAGARLATVIPESVVIAGFAVVMLGAALAMWRKSSAVESMQDKRTAPWVLPVVAIAIGLLTGIFGVGGGFLIVPALVLVFGFPFAIATGTSLVVVALNSLTALAFKFDTWGEIPWTVPALVIVGGLVGSVVASTMNHGIPQRVLERAFAVLLVILACWMAFETAFVA
jgi:uncharacterized membrane protein YfcA